MPEEQFYAFLFKLKKETYEKNLGFRERLEAAGGLDEVLAVVREAGLALMYSRRKTWMRGAAKPRKPGWLE